MTVLDAPWQNGMVERRGGVLGDIIEAIVLETSPTGYQQMCDECLHAAIAKNRRPERTGYSLRALVFGCDKQLIASGLTITLNSLMTPPYTPSPTIQPTNDPSTSDVLL